MAEKIIVPDGLRRAMQSREWALYLAYDDEVERSRVEVAIRTLRETQIFERMSWHGMLGDWDRGHHAEVIDAIATIPAAREALIRALAAIVGRRPALPRWSHGLRGLDPDCVLTNALDDRATRLFPNLPAWTHADAGEVLNLLGGGARVLLQLFGDLRKPHTVCLSKADYEMVRATNLLLARLVNTVVSTRSLLIVGASIETLQPHLVLLGMTGAAPVREHYAVVPVGEQAMASRALFFRRRFGVTIIPATGASGRRDAVDEVLAQIAVRVRDRFSVSLRPRRKPPSFIRKVEFENIGPFPKITLDLSSKFNLFVGDNGSGKTTLLRAIAIAVGGEDLDREAATIVRSGASTARITIETDGARYVTEIARTDVGVRMQSIPARPLEIEGWLVLGFPAVRVIGTDVRGSERVQELRAKGRASADDVLPLLRNGPDTRIQNAREWLLESFAGAENTPPLALDVIGILQRVVPRFDVEAGAMNRLEDVYNVRTPYGEVPIEAMSQGTAALFGWIGVLIRRLREFYGSGDIRRRRAIVLIDEIDAHMHPRWQRAIVSRLRTVFPRVQFIATTHSPLAVTAADPSELMRLIPRDGSVEVMRDPRSVKGWRADQVLTSAVFDLDTTRDEETEAKLEQYSHLSMYASTPAAREKLRELATDLERRLPTPFERERTRELYAILMSALQSRASNLSLEDVRAIDREFERLIAELGEQA